MEVRWQHHVMLRRHRLNGLFVLFRTCCGIGFVIADWA